MDDASGHSFLPPKLDSCSGCGVQKAESGKKPKHEIPPSGPPPRVPPMNSGVLMGPSGHNSKQQIKVRD